MKKQNFVNQNKFKEFMENEIKDNEKFQAYIYLDEIRNNLRDLELLDQKVNNKELYNKKKKKKKKKESEFYFEYDENNIEFKNNQRDFYKIKCKVEDDMKNKKKENENKENENKENENKENEPAKKLLEIKENELKSLQDRALLKSKK